MGSSSLAHRVRIDNWRLLLQQRPKICPSTNECLAQISHRYITKIWSHFNIPVSIPESSFRSDDQYGGPYSSKIYMHCPLEYKDIPRHKDIQFLAQMITSLDACLAQLQQPRNEVNAGTSSPGANPASETRNADISSNHISEWLIDAAAGVGKMAGLQPPIHGCLCAGIRSIGCRDCWRCWNIRSEVLNKHAYIIKLTSFYPRKASVMTGCLPGFRVSS